jgi:pimeloyl-ACP methyl ester carboxylesterase
VAVTTDACLLPDGRRLAYAEYGDPSGVPVLFLHGSPGGRLGGAVNHARYVRQGLRVITPERPGYGESDPAPGRSVRDAAEDLVALLDTLGLDRVFVVGGSGGGPHALALAAVAPERVHAAGVLVGAAPLLPDEVAAQVELNQKVHGSLADPDALRALLGSMREVMLAQGITALLTDAPESDKAQWQKNVELMDVAMRSAMEPGVEGLLDDYLAIWSRPWGFEPADVKVPVVWAAGADDKNVPLSAARRVADQLPDCRFLTWEGVGHAPQPDLLAEFLTALLARAL